MAETTSLANPEQHWSRSDAPPSITRDDINERVGAIDEPFELLDGGLANANVRIGEERLLRLYHRDASTVSKEAQLLDQSWTHLRVPEVLETGPDFLLLEFVEHRPLEGIADHGEAVGRALAEIHRRSFEHADLLDDDLSAVDEPFDGVFSGFREFIATHTDPPAPLRDLRHRMRTIVDQGESSPRTADSRA